MDDHSSHLSSHLAAVIANPEDDAPRIAYADACEESDRARARFIRLSCELARIPNSYERDKSKVARQKKLAEENAERWGNEVLEDEQWAGHDFQRGFLHSYWFSRDHSLEQARQVFERAPITALSIDSREGEGGFCSSDEEGEVDEHALSIMNEPFLQRLRSFSLAENDLSARSFARFLSAPGLVNVTHLRLDESFDEVHAAALRGTTGLVQPEHLDWTGYMGGLGDEGLRDVLDSSLVDRVRRLDLGGHNLRVDGARALSECPRLTNLRELTLGASGYANNEFGEEGFELLTTAPWFPQLEMLAMAFEKLGTGIRALTERGTSLRALYPSYSEIEPDAISALVSGAHWSGIEKLSLNMGKLGDAGAIALAAAQHLPSTLHLVGCELGFRGVEALSKTGARFDLLDLSSNPIDETDWRYLAHKNAIPRAAILAITEKNMPAFVMNEVAAHVGRLDVFGQPGGMVSVPGKLGND